MERAGQRARDIEHCLAAAVVACALVLAACDTWQGDSEAGVGTTSSAIHSSHSGPAPWPHVLTCYGGCAAPHYDPSACGHNTSCGPIADGTWWYATERAAFYCGAKLKLVRGDKCVVVEVQDNGPADWVEDNAAATCGVGDIIDTSPLVHDYFGGGCGWGECFVVWVSQVPDNTPTGPAGCQACNPGQVQSQACGNCGTKTRTCSSNGQWSAWSTCQGQGVCSPGAKQSRDCCDCGTQARTCTASCQWADWGSCSGPDPAGGSQSCDTGEPGPCADGRMRCVGGCLDCVRAYQPTAELCDGIDNDCSGAIDDGSPQTMGATPPSYAARLVDFTYPSALQPGRDASAWAEFENVGAEAWQRGQVWLGSVTASSGDPSAFYDEADWPAWDVVAVLEEDVPPGETGHFGFKIRTPQQGADWIVEEFQITDPDGEMMACPSPTLPLEVLVGGPPAGADDRAGEATGDDTLAPLEGGCCLLAGDRSASAPGAPLSLIVLLLAWLAVRTAVKEK